MRFEAKTLFTLFMVAISAYTLLSAWDWPFGTRLFPLIMGFTALILSLFQLSWELYQSAHAKSSDKREETGDLQIDWRMGSRVVARRAGIFFGWLFGFFVCIWIFGFFCLRAFVQFSLSEVASQRRLVVVVSSDTCCLFILRWPF